MVLDHLNDAELERFLAKKAKDAALTPSNPPPQFPVRTVRAMSRCAQRAQAPMRETQHCAPTRLMSVLFT